MRDKSNDWLEEESEESLRFSRLEARISYLEEKIEYLELMLRKYDIVDVE